MFDVFGSVKGLAKVEKLCIDNNVFRLHYKATVLILVAFSLVVTSKQYIGDPIDCIVDEIPQNVMDTYCWIYSTFTIPDHLTGRVGKDMAHPGVGSHIPEEDEMMYHKYYQWVCFVLLFQAILFYVPRYLWKSWECGRIKLLLMGMNDSLNNKEDRKKALASYFDHNMGSHNMYFYKFLFCELLNLLNVIGQIFFTDFFLDGEFLSYGHKVSQYNNGAMDDDVVDPMARVFPKVTKCTFHKYGPSGTVQKLDGLCVLPVNIINEKIYLILWFWFIILSIITIILMIYRIFIILSRCTRVRALAFGAGDINRWALENLVYACGVGDWFILERLKANMHSRLFGEVVDTLNTQLMEKNNSCCPPKEL